MNPAPLPQVHHPGSCSQWSGSGFLVVDEQSNNCVFSWTVFLSIKDVFWLRFDTNIRDARFPGCFVSVEVSHISSPLLRPWRVVFTGSASVWMAHFLLLLRAHRGMWLWIMSMVTSNLIDFKDFRVYKSVIGVLISQTLTVKSSLGLLLQGLSFQSWIDLFGW